MAAGRSNAFFDKILPVVYSLGAAVVIMGALFKIRHLPGADIMLTVGMVVEAIIFALFALQTFVQPPAREYEWEKVYPELNDGTPAVSGKQDGVNLTGQMDKMLSQAKITPEIFDNLGKGFKSLTDTVAKMSDISDASVASGDFARNAKNTSTALVEMNKSLGVSISAMSEMAGATQESKEYRMQFQSLTKNMGALNAVYELELQDANHHIKAMNSFYGSIAGAMQNITDASKDAQQFKHEMARLSTNLNSLNTVYGSMLTAMRGQ